MEPNTVVKSRRVAWVCTVKGTVGLFTHNGHKRRLHLKKLWFGVMGCAATTHCVPSEKEVCALLSVCMRAQMVSLLAACTAVSWLAMLRWMQGAVAECSDAAVNVMHACAEQLCILLVRTNEAVGKKMELQLEGQNLRTRKKERGGGRDREIWWEQISGGVWWILTSFSLPRWIHSSPHLQMLLNWTNFKLTQLNNFPKKQKWVSFRSKAHGLEMMIRSLTTLFTWIFN